MKFLIEEFEQLISSGQDLGSKVRRKGKKAAKAGEGESVAESECSRSQVSYVLLDEE